MPSTDFPFGYNNLPNKHKIRYCTLCQTDRIVCGKCGNNCCNGGYGTLPDGTECDACPEAYKLQDEMWAKQDKETECPVAPPQ